MDPRRVLVHWTQGALDDLESILERISEDSPSTASNILQQVLDLGSSLETLPERGRVVPERSDDRLRELLFSSFRVIYQSADAVTILAVLHQRQDFESWLYETGRGPL